VLEQTTRERKNSREWRVLQEKAQRKTRITVHVGDKVMEVGRVCNATNQNTQNSEHRMKLDKTAYQVGGQ
jgi:hypothetical protein